MWEVGPYDMRDEFKALMIVQVYCPWSHGILKLMVVEGLLARSPSIRRLRTLFRSRSPKFDTAFGNRPRVYTVSMSSSPVSPRSKTRILAIELPESVVQLLGPTTQQAARHLAEVALIDLFRQGELSGGKAAEALGLNREQWLNLLAQHGVPHAVVTEESLAHDLKTLADRRARRVTSSPTPDR
jgi:predicted HTH domain antitoxin